MRTVSTSIVGVRLQEPALARREVNGTAMSRVVLIEQQFTRLAAADTGASARGAAIEVPAFLCCDAPQSMLRSHARHFIA